MAEPGVLASAFRFRSTYERRVFAVTVVFILALSVASAFLSPLKILALILSVVALAVAITRPYLVVVGLAVWTPLEPFLLKFVPDELYVYARYFPEALLYVLAVLVVIHVLLERRRLPSTPIDFTFILFLFALVCSSLINLVPISTTVLGYRQILRYLVLFFAVVYLAPPKTRIRQTILIMLGMLAFESALGILQAVAGGGLDEFLIPSDRKFFDSIQLTAGTQQFWAPGERVFATMGRYDQLGTFITFFLLLALGLAYEVREKVSRHWLIIIFALALPALVLTYSRASWFGFALGVLLIGLAVKRDRRVVLGVTLIVAALAVTFFYERVVLRYIVDVPQQTVIERLFEAFTPERLKGEYYGLGRVYWLVQTPLVVVPSAPIFGVGPGRFGGGAAAALHNTDAYDRLGLPFGVFGTEGQIDSNWMSLWGETGTLGIIFYVMMFAVLARLALRLYRKSDDGWTRGLALGFLGAEVAVTFQAFLGTYLEVRTLALYFWLLAAMLVVLAKREEISV